MESLKVRRGTSITSPANPPVLLGVPFLLFLPSGGEFIIIFFAVLLLFGGEKIPELMRGVGKGIQEFNNARDGLKKSLEESIRQAEREAEATKYRADKEPTEGNEVEK